MERITTGIKQIDEMIEGGLPREAVIGLSGPPGIGKSIFALQFIFSGAKNGEKGVYVALEEPRENLEKAISEFSFAKEFFDLEKKGLIVIKCFNYAEYNKINFDLLKKVYEDDKVKRLVIDSFNCFFDSLDFSSCSENHVNIRKNINQSFSYLRKKNLCVFLVLEKHENSLFNFEYNIPYLVDGMIKLDYLDFGIIERRILIPKMRWTNQDKGSKKYEISSEGITFSFEK